MKMVVEGWFGFEFEIRLAFERAGGGSDCTIPTRQRLSPVPIFSPENMTSHWKT